MSPNQIKIGALYKCKSGWYREAESIDEAPGYPVVRYRTGRTPSNLYSRGFGSVFWFVDTIVSEVNS